MKRSRTYLKLLAVILGLLLVFQFCIAYAIDKQKLDIDCWCTFPQSTANSSSNECYVQAYWAILNHCSRYDITYLGCSASDCSCTATCKSGYSLTIWCKKLCANGLPTPF